MAFTDSDEDSPRPQLHGEGADRRLLLCFDGGGHLPESVRAAMAAARIRHRSPGATPQPVAQALVEGAQTWKRFRAQGLFGVR